MCQRNHELQISIISQNTIFITDRYFYHKKLIHNSEEFQILVHRNLVDKT